MSEPITEEAWARARDDDERLRLLVQAAILAPSGHNTQPWLFRVRGGALDILADRTRALPVVDPEDRELTLSVGAALAHVRIAAARFGRATETTLLPDADDPDRLARVRLGGSAAPQHRPLYDAIAQRFTDRGPYGSWPVDPDDLEALARRAADEGAWLVALTDDARKAALADSIAEGDRLQMRDARFRRELAAWVHPNRSRHREGLPGFALGVSSDAVSGALPLVLRLFDVGRGQAKRDRAIAEASPALLVLGTDDETTEAWLRAGQALAFVWLEAVSRGLHMSFLNQPVEVPELRADVGMVAERPGFPQLVMRVGVPAGDRDARRTLRRPLADVLLEP